MLSKKNQLKTEQLLNQTFSTEKISKKRHRNFMKLFASWEIRYIIWLFTTMASQHVQAVGFGPLLNQMNFHLSCIHMASIMLSWHKCYNLVKVLSTEFLAWVVFIKTKFSCLNLRVDDGFLPFSMPEVFNKT